MKKKIKKSRSKILEKKARKAKVIDELVSLGKSKGHLTYEELNEVLPDDMVSSEDINQVMDTLDKEDIALIDADKEKQPFSLPTCYKKDILKEDEEISRLAQADDPVKMYLREMGQIPLLTREQEIALAEKIKNAEEQIRKNVLSTKIARRIVIRILEDAFSKNMSLDEIHMAIW